MVTNRFLFPGMYYGDSDGFTDVWLSLHEKRNNEKSALHFYTDAVAGDIYSSFCATSTIKDFVKVLIAACSGEKIKTEYWSYAVNTGSFLTLHHRNHSKKPGSKTIYLQKTSNVYPYNIKSLLKWLNSRGALE